VQRHVGKLLRKACDWQRGEGAWQGKSVQFVDEQWSIKSRPGHEETVSLDFVCAVVMSYGNQRLARTRLGVSQSPMLGRTTRKCKFKTTSL
jgi:hypothetical protein